MPIKTKEKKVSKTELDAAIHNTFCVPMRKIEEKNRELGWEGKRFTPCTCGGCGLIWDTKHDISIAWFTGPDKKEEVPLPRELQQKYMAAFCKAMNEYVEKHGGEI